MSTSEEQKKKPREIRELKEKLSGLDVDEKQEAIRGIISYMTNGKDVSSLFMDVLKNITTPSLQLKKLIYLYVMSYAKAHPDLAILGVNTFRKVFYPLPRTLWTKQIPSLERWQSELWAVLELKTSPSIFVILSKGLLKMKILMFEKLVLFAYRNFTKLHLNSSTEKDFFSCWRTSSMTVMPPLYLILWFLFRSVLS